MARRAHLDDVDAELAVLAGHAGQACGVNRRPGDVAQLLAVDIGDVRELVTAVGHAADRTGDLGRRAVETRRAQEIGVGVADVEAVEGLPTVEAAEHRPPLERVVDHASRSRGISDILWLGPLGLGLATLAEHTRSTRLRRTGLGHVSTLSESGR